MAPKKTTHTASKRRRQRDDDSENDDAADRPVALPSKRAKLKVKEERLQKVYRSSAVGLAKAIHDAVRDVPNKYTKGDRDHFLTLLPEAEFDEDWTQEDDTRLEEVVMASDEGKDIMGVKDSLIGV